MVPGVRTPAGLSPLISHSLSTWDLPKQPLPFFAKRRTVKRLRLFGVGRRKRGPQHLSAETQMRLVEVCKTASRSSCRPLVWRLVALKSIS